MVLRRLWKCYLFWNSARAAFILVIMDPMLPTIVAKIRTPIKKSIVTNKYSKSWNVLVCSGFVHKLCQSILCTIVSAQKAMNPQSYAETSFMGVPLKLLNSFSNKYFIKKFNFYFLAQPCSCDIKKCQHKPKSSPCLKQWVNGNA